MPTTVILGLCQLQVQNSNLWLLLILGFWNLNFANLCSVRADHLTSQSNLTDLNYFTPGFRAWCFFITSSSVLWACSFCTISSASRMRRFSWGECSEGVSSLSYDSRIARIPSRSCQEEQQTPLGIQPLTHSKERVPKTPFYISAHYSFKDKTLMGETLIIFTVASRPRWIHSSNRTNVAALNTEELDCLCVYKTTYPLQESNTHTF